MLLQLHKHPAPQKTPAVLTPQGQNKRKQDYSSA